MKLYSSESSKQMQQNYSQLCNDTAQSPLLLICVTITTTFRRTDRLPNYTLINYYNYNNTNFWFRFSSYTHNWQQILDSITLTEIKSLKEPRKSFY